MSSVEDVSLSALSDEDLISAAWRANELASRQVDEVLYRYLSDEDRKKVDDLQAYYLADGTDTGSVVNRIRRMEREAITTGRGHFEIAAEARHA